MLELEVISLTQLLLCWGIVIFAAILQVSVGMGFGMLASPLIALVAPELVPGSILVMGLVVAAAGTWKERRNIELIEVKLGFGGRVIGSAMATGLLFLIPDRDAFFVVFGVLVLLAVLLTASGLKLAFNNRNLGLLSIVSGVMGTITAVGAPPMAIIYHGRDPKIVRPTLNAFFGAGAVLGIVSLGLTGWLSIHDFTAALLLLPAMVLGIAIGEPFKKLSASFLSHILLGLSGASALLLIVKGLV